MKRILGLWLLVATLYPTTGKSSHFLSGYIGVIQTSNDSVRLQVSLYLDSNGMATPQVSVERWDFSGGIPQLNGTVSLTQQNVTVFQGVQIVSYLSLPLQLASGTYRFVYKHCCRNPLVMNMPTLAPAFQSVMGTDYTKTPASGPPSTHSNTPIFTSPVPFQLMEDTAQLLAFGTYLTEPDGDSLAVELDSILIDHGASGFVGATGATPLSAWGPYLVGPSTLNVLWRPDSAGLFAAGWRIKEFRNGQIIGTQHVQHHFRVLPNLPSSVRDPERGGHESWNPEAEADFYNLNGQLIYRGIWGKERRFDGVLVIRQGRRTWKQVMLP